MKCVRTKISSSRAFFLAFLVALVYCLKTLFPAGWINDDVKSKGRFERRESFIFIGGFPGSGTTLMRVILDSHPSIRCGQETRVIPKLLHTILPRTKLEAARQIEAGVTREVLDSAVAAFLTEIISKHGAPAKRLCNKDPLVFRKLSYVAKLFPKAKFILMVRDGRAVIHSIKSRGVTIAGIDTHKYELLLRTWSDTVLRMDAQCVQLGASRCLRVAYEELVLRPTHCMEKVLKFLDVKWNEAILQHELQVRTPGQVLLSRFEKSSSQVQQAIHTGSLDRWRTGLPPLLLKKAAWLAPALWKFGYINEKPNKTATSVLAIQENQSTNQSIYLFDSLYKRLR